MKGFFEIFRKVVPWLIAVLIFAYLFTQYRPTSILMAIRQANLLYFLGLGVTYFIVLYVIDCYTMSRVLGRFGFPVGFRELLPARGVTYLIMNINYPASQAAFAYYLKRTKGVPIFEVMSVFLFIIVIDLYVLMSVAFVGSFFQRAVVDGVDIGEYVRMFVLIAYGAFLAALAFWRRWIQRLAGSEKEFRITRWFRSKKLFVVFNDARTVDYLKIALLRSPIHIFIVVFLYFAVHAFYAHVPIVGVISSVPIAFLVGTLPITPGGLGTTNYAIVKLLSPYVAGSAIDSGSVSGGDLLLAVTIAWVAVNFLLKSAVGMLWLTKVSNKLFKPTGDDSPQDVGKKLPT